MFSKTEPDFLITLDRRSTKPPPEKEVDVVGRRAVHAEAEEVLRSSLAIGLSATVLATLASLCLLVMVIVWAVWINPINKTVNSWTPESLPSNRADFRDRWHSLHTIRLVLSAVAFSAVISALLA